VDNDLRGLDRVCDAVEATGGPAPGFCELDLAAAGPAEMDELVAALQEAYGPLDALVHCAAHFEALQPLEQLGGDVWLRTFQVNLNAAWLLSMTCLPSLKLSPCATIVFVLDDPQRSQSAYWGAYGISKGALRALVGMLAEEIQSSDCRIFGVDPGPMRTRLRARAYMAENPADIPGPDAAARHITRLVLGQGDSGDIFQGLGES